MTAAYHYIFITTLVLFLLAHSTQAQNMLIADSLLENREYSKSVREYQLIISGPQPISIADKGNAYLRMGKGYYYLNKKDSALVAYFKALSIFKVLDNAERIAAATSNIALTYFNMNDLSNAEKYYSQSLKYSKTMKDSASIAAILNDWAAILAQKGKKKEAISLHKTVIRDYRTALSNEVISNSYLNIANYYLNSYKDSAIFYLDQAERFADGDQKKLSLIYNNKGYTYQYAGEYRMAINTFKLAWDMNDPKEDFQLLSYLAQNIANAYDSLAVDDSAKLYLRATLYYNDLLIDQQKSRFAAELSEKYESDKKDEKIKNQEIENKLKSRNLFLSLGGLGLVAALAMVSFISYNRKQKANKLLQTQNEHIQKLNRELDSSNQVKTKLFSVISHDLRSPISSLYAYLQLNKKEADNRNDVLIMQSEQLLETLEDLLVWSKSQLHQFSVFIEEINLYALTDNLVQLHQANALQKKVTVINEIPAQAILRTDLNILTIVLRNLLSNAIKFSVPHSTIRLSAVIQDAITITVSNQSNDEHSRLLQALQDDDISSHKSGLGITLIKEFVSKLNGQFSYSVNHHKVTASLQLPQSL